MNIIPEWIAIAIDFAMQAEKATEVFLVKEMRISWCAHSAGWCQDQQKIFNSQKKFKDLINLLYWIKKWQVEVLEKNMLTSGKSCLFTGLHLFTKQW